MIVDPEVDSSRAVCDKTYSCANCTATRICRPDPNVTGAFITYDVACSSYIPYCDENSGTCTSKVPFSCLNDTSYIEGEFMCLKNGMFPHPLSNRKYFECRNYISYTYNCTGPYYYRYNPVDEECNNRGNYYYFGSCSGYNGLKKAYTPSQFYAYCINSEIAFMDKCDGEYKLNETSQMCEPVCEYPGLLEDATNCRKYYKCRTKPEYSYQSKYERTSHTCPDGFGFSQEDFQCVPLESIPWCKQSTTKDILGLQVDTEQDNDVIHDISNLSHQVDDHQLQ
uniref:Peritrophin-like protein n=1 Tax=Nilaparvata lugens TaxID=108931 RepID=A0A191UR46_NILLU|nr:peritrophin-like protein [Nilaparvata lugens]